MSVNPHLWSSITDAMDESRYFVLLTSPDAAVSPWVNREIAQWLQTHGSETLLPVLTDGTLVWSEALRDFDPEQSTALPAAIRNVYADEPRHLDLRWARGADQLDLRHSQFRAQIATLAAPIHGVAREDLEGEDVRLHRRALRLAGAGAAVLVALTVAALIATFVAVGYAATARDNENRAERNLREAVVQRTRAVKQTVIADTNAERAASNQAKAEEQEKLAEAKAAEARTNEAKSKASEALAKENEIRANANAARATALAGDLADSNAQLTCANGELGNGINDLRAVLESARGGQLTPLPPPPPPPGSPIQDQVENLEATIEWLEATSAYHLNTLEYIEKLTQTSDFSSPCGLAIPARPEPTIPPGRDPRSLPDPAPPPPGSSGS